MKKLIIILLVLSQSAIAQQVQWRNNFELGNRSTDNVGVGVDSRGNVFTYGYSLAYSVRVGNNSFRTAILTKHNPNTGDTVSCKRLGFTNELLPHSFTVANNFAVFIITEATDPLSRHRLKVYSTTLERFIIDTLVEGVELAEYYSDLQYIPGKGYLASGFWQGRTLSDRKFCAIMLDESFRLKWHQRLDEIKLGFSPTPLPNGKVLVIGPSNTGFRAIQLDSNGAIESNRSISFPFPSNSSVMQASAKLLPNNNFILAVTSRDNNSGSQNSRIVKYSPDWSSSSWQIEDSSIIVKMSVHWDNSFMVAGFPWVSKYDSSGTLIWRSRYYEMPSFQLPPVVTSVVYPQNGDVLIAGGYDPINGAREAMTIRVSGMGQEFRPAEPRPPLSVEKNQEPNLQVYPNPFTNTLRLSHKGTAQLLDVHGRVIISQAVEAGEELKVGNLPKGMYLLRLQSVGGKLYVRKVVKD